MLNNIVLISVGINYCYVWDVVMMQCITDLLDVEKCSSGKARERTTCSINRVVMGSVSYNYFPPCFNVATYLILRTRSNYLPYCYITAKTAWDVCADNTVEGLAVLAACTTDVWQWYMQNGLQLNADNSEALVIGTSIQVNATSTPLSMFHVCRCHWSTSRWLHEVYRRGAGPSSVIRLPWDIGGQGVQLPRSHHLTSNVDRPGTHPGM